MAGMWTEQLRQRGIKLLDNHPWVKLFRDTLEVVSPELFLNLQTDGELDAYATLKVDEAKKDIRRYQADGMEYETARELAFEDMLPAVPQHAEPWEIEGGMEDMADAFDQFTQAGVDDDAGSPSTMDD